MSAPIRDDPNTDAEEALIQRVVQRVVRRLDEARQSAVDGAGTAALAAADVAGSAANKVGYAAGTVGKVAGDAASQIAEYAKNATQFARKIVESRRSGQEPIAQLLFRVPENLRDDVKRLALDERRQMDELLTEAVLDLLIKHGRLPKAIEKVRTDRTE